MPSMRWAYAMLLSFYVASVSAVELEGTPPEERLSAPHGTTIADRTESAGFNPFATAALRQATIPRAQKDEEPDLMPSTVCAALGLLTVGALLRAIWTS